MQQKLRVLPIALAMALTAPASYATNGMLAHGYGTQSKGMAGTGVAYGTSAMIAATNPANMITVGNRVEGGLAIFSPRREYDASYNSSIAGGLAPLDTGAPGAPIQLPVGTFFVGNGNNETGKNYFYIPHLAFNMMLDPNSSFGVTIGGNGGMNTHYSVNHKTNAATFVGDFPGDGTPDLNNPANQQLLSGAPAQVSTNPCDPQAARMSGSDDAGAQAALAGRLPLGFTGDSLADNGAQRVPGIFGDCQSAGIDLSQLFMGLTYARKMGNTNAGVTLLLAAQQFKAYGLNSFASFVADGNPDDLTNNGYDYAYGMGVRLGVTHSFSDMFTLGASYQTKTYMTKLDKYSDLFANGGELDIPASVTIGLAVKPMNGLVLALDIQHIWYSDVDAIGNSNDLVGRVPNESCVMGDFSRCLGGSNGAGFFWNDLTVIKLGVEFEVNSSLALRAGYSRSTNQVVPDDQLEFNILAPATIRAHFTIGATFKISNSDTISFAGMYAPREHVKGVNRFAGGLQNLDVSMKQYELELSYSHQF